VSLKNWKTHGLLLHCQTATNRKHDSKSIVGPIVHWFKDGQLVNDTKDERVKTLVNGTLKINILENSDAGGYSCSLKTSGGIVSIPLTIQMQATSEGGIQARPNCHRDLGVTDCHKVVIGGLCRHKYYGPACCQSCARSAVAKRAAAQAKHRRLRQR